MKNIISKLILLSLTVLGLAFITSEPKVWADDNEIPFSEAHIFFELNNTEGI